MEYLDVFDLLRSSLGGLVCCLLFIEGMFPRRQDFIRRIITGGWVLLLFTLSNLPVTTLLAGSISALVVYYAVYYSVICYLIIWFCWFCYDITPLNALVRGLLGSCLQQFITCLYIYGAIKLFAPDFTNLHPVWYSLLTAGVYLLLCVLARCLLIPHIRRLNVIYTENRQATLLYVVLHLLCSCFWFLCQTIFDLLLTPVAEAEIYEGNIHITQFCQVALMLFITLALVTTVYASCYLFTLRQENDLLQSMMVEKEKQYRLSQENIAIINQKCHDLKHQISAMAYAQPEQRLTMIEEAEKAVLIYGSVVQTESEALNTLLTEKSLYCAQHNIRLQCFVNNIHAQQLAHINVIDLYTMLGNGLDNAIECVSDVEDEEYKTIHLSIEEQGGMLFFTIENHNDAPVCLVDGLPATSKQDKTAHGFGLKSIRMIAQKYGGALYISNESQVFTLRIAISAE
ncbi:MAG: ATP-binding protein [Clostridiales bacterium]|nr:ATP-binding protein [Clostridiales bacterium]